MDPVIEVDVDPDSDDADEPLGSGEFIPALDRPGVGGASEGSTRVNVRASTTIYLEPGVRDIIRVCWVLDNPVRLHRMAEGTLGPTDPTGTVGPFVVNLTSNIGSESRVTPVVTGKGHRGAQKYIAVPGATA